MPKIKNPFKRSNAQMGNFFNTKMKEKIATAKLERQVINSMRNYFEKKVC